MRNGGTILFSALLLLIASSYYIPNNSPAAYIDSSTPSNPHTGRLITLTGHGSDEDDFQFRFKLIGDSEVKTTAPDITLYYETR